MKRRFTPRAADDSVGAAMGVCAPRSVSVFNRQLTGWLLAAMLPLVPALAVAQEAPRTIGQYDREVSGQYVRAWEKGNRAGDGFLAQGGYKVWSFRGWQLQGIGEMSFTRFDYFNATFKQYALGVRAGRLLWPKVRTFAQFQAGVQNDGFDNSSNGAVFLPGIGFNYAVARRFDAQVLIDFPIAQYDAGTYDQVRVGVGLGLPLGRR